MLDKHIFHHPKLSKNCQGQENILFTSNKFVEVKVPVAEFGDDFECYFEVTEDEKSLFYPATAREFHCSLVVM